MDDHLPLQDKVLRAKLFGRRTHVTRARGGGAYIIDFAAYAAARLAQEVASEVRLQGPDRLVMIVPLAGPAPSEYLTRNPPNRRGPRLLHLRRQKMFLVAAEVDERGRFHGQGLSLELDAYTRFDQRSSIVRYLAAA